MTRLIHHHLSMKVTRSFPGPICSIPKAIVIGWRTLTSNACDVISPALDIMSANNLLHILPIYSMTICTFRHEPRRRDQGKSRPSYNVSGLVYPLLCEARPWAWLKSLMHHVERWFRLASQAFNDHFTNFQFQLRWRISFLTHTSALWLPFPLTSYQILPEMARVSGRAARCSCQEIRGSRPSVALPLSLCQGIPLNA